MPHIRVNVLKPLALEVDGEEKALTPLTIRLLIRLVAAGGEPVPVVRLRRDVWDIPPGYRHDSVRDRNEVQKRVCELRKVIDPGRQGRASGSCGPSASPPPAATSPPTGWC
ncbi:hypothetical protein ACFQ9X_54785 [Catenulispora yoronensis]